MLMLRMWMAAVTLLEWPLAAVSPSVLETTMDALFAMQPFSRGPLLVVTADSAPKRLHWSRRGRLLTLPPGPTDVDVTSAETALLKRTPLTVLLSTPAIARERVVSLDPPRGCIFILQDGEDPSATMKASIQAVRHYSVMWSPRSRTVVVFITREQEHQQTIALLLSLLNKHDVVDTTVVTLVVQYRDVSGFSVGTLSDVFIYTWWPFSPSGRCRDNRIQATLMDKWNFQLHNFPRNSSVFVSKVPKNLNGCPVKTLVLILPPNVERFKHDESVIVGRDVTLVNIVAETMNFRLITEHTEEWATAMHILFNDNLSLSTHIFLNKFEMMYGTVPAIISNLFPFEITTTYGRETLTWFVPRPPPASPVTVLIDSQPDFMLAKLLAIVTVFAITSVSLSNKSEKLIKIIKSEKSDYRTLIPCFINLLSLFYGTTVTQPLRWISRVVFITWVLYSFFFQMLASSFVTSHMTHPSLARRIKSVEELRRSGLVIKSIRPIASYCNRIMTTNLPRIAANCNTYYECLDRAAFRRDTAVVGTKGFMKHEAKVRYHDKSGAPLLLPLEADIGSYDLVVGVAKGSPLLPAISDTILRINEAHLVWPALRMGLMKLRTNVSLDSELTGNEDDKTEETVATPTILKTFVILYLSMMAVPLFVLLTEIIVHQWFRTSVPVLFFEKFCYSH